MKPTALPPDAELAIADYAMDMCVIRTQLDKSLIIGGYEDDQITVVLTKRQVAMLLCYLSCLFE